MEMMVLKSSNNSPEIYGFRTAMCAAELVRLNWIDAGYCLDALDIAPAGSVYLFPMKSEPPVIRNSTAWIR